MGIEEPGIGVVDKGWAFYLECGAVGISFFSSFSSPQEKAAGNLGARL